MTRSLQNFFFVCLILSCFVYSWYIARDNPKPIIQVSEQERQLNFNKEAIQAFSLGQNRFISSLLWIQTLMDSDLEHYKGKDLNSWMYLRFDTITALDPLFYEAYSWGGIYLSIVKDDVIGAAKIYEKGLKHFPNDMSLNFNAGFNYFFELGEIDKAIQNFETVLSTSDGNKTYPKLVGLVERMKRETGTPYYEILHNLKSRLDNIKDSKIKSYIKNTMYAVKATADLECLNESRSDCQKVDLFGRPYTKQTDGKYRSVKPFKPFKLYRRND